MKSRWLGVSLTYVGAVVGAGFASGQEIYQFFGRYGPFGIGGLFLAGLLFFFLGFLALERGRRDHVVAFGELLRRVYPPFVVRVAEGVTAAFLLVGLGVVASGGGAALEGIVHTPPLVGSLVTTLAIILIVRRGTQSVLRANSVLIPYLVVLVVMVSILTWGHAVKFVPVGGQPGWALSALLYLSYNIFTGIMVLLGLGPSLRTRRDSVWAALLGAGILTTLGLLEHHALMRGQSRGSLPMVAIAFGIHPTWGGLYSVSLWVALLTTGVAEAYALTRQYGPHMIWVISATFLFGLLGFERLVASLYPLMGLVAILLWAPLIYRKRVFPGG